MLVEEPYAGSSPQDCGWHEASVLYRSEYNPYFKTNVRLYPSLEFVLKGGFDRHDCFFFIPLGASEVLTEIWRRRAVQWLAIGVVALFLDKGLLNPDFAHKLIGWEHSGFSIESGTRIQDQPTREALCQYIVSAPLSLQRIRLDEQQDALTWSSSPSGPPSGAPRRVVLLSGSPNMEGSSNPPIARARMSVIALIVDPAQIRKIISCL